MRIIPAIDIIDGKCVRLSKGKYSTKKIYNEIFEKQKKRIFNALKDSDPVSVVKFKDVLKKIINGKK